MVRLFSNDVVRLARFLETVLDPREMFLSRVRSVAEECEITNELVSQLRSAANGEESSDVDLIDTIASIVGQLFAKNLMRNPNIANAIQRLWWNPPSWVG